MNRYLLRLFAALACVAVCVPIGCAAERKPAKHRVKAKNEVVKSQPKQQKQVMKPAAKNLSTLEKVTYSYQGMMMEPVRYVELARKADGKVHFIINEDKDYTPADGEELMMKAEKIILEEKMLDYARHYAPPMQPLDGYSWHFSAKFADGRSVNSGGSNAQPGGEGLSKMGSLLKDRGFQLLKDDKQVVW